MNVRILGPYFTCCYAGMLHATLNSMAAKDDKLQGTCGVCLRPIQLHADRPIRHGFSAIGVKHGQHSGHHTGPCAGSGFPHLGISTDGTRWALGRAHQRLEGLRGSRADLAANPDLTWYPKKYDVRGGRLDLAKPFLVKYGDEAPFVVGRFSNPPSYAELHQGRVAELKGYERATEGEIAEYDRVLSSWSPGKYPTIGTKAKATTVHMERPITIRGQTEMGVLCKGLRGQRLLKTADPAKVTCKRCRATLGLPLL
jgi:hypothetical protein